MCVRLGTAVPSVRARRLGHGRASLSRHDDVRLRGPHAPRWGGPGSRGSRWRGPGNCRQSTLHDTRYARVRATQPVDDQRAAGLGPTPSRESAQPACRSCAGARRRPPPGTRGFPACRRRRHATRDARRTRWSRPWFLLAAPPNEWRAFRGEAKYNCLRDCELSGCPARPDLRELTGIKIWGVTRSTRFPQAAHAIGRRPAPPPRARRIRVASSTRGHPRIPA